MARTTRRRLTVEVLRHFRVVYGSVQRHFRQTESSCGISGAQVWMLQEISTEPGIGISALAARLAIHQSTCSLLANKLVRGGLAKKERRSRDQRRIGLSVTARGARLVAHAPRPAEGLLPKALTALSDAELRRLHAGLGTLVSRLERKSRSAAGRPLSEFGVDYRIER